MKTSLFLLMFLTAGGVQSLLYKYYLIQQGKNWSDAQAYCRATHTDLAITKSNDDVVQLQNEAQTQHFTSKAWIGLYDDFNSWRWSYGNEPLGSMRPWKSGDPNNKAGKQFCGAMSPIGWWDLDCAVLYPCICLDDSKTGNERYVYISENMSWFAAQSYCRQYYTDLASSKDPDEDLVIKGLTSGNTWFGLFRDSWKWVDHTKFSTLSWMSGQPDNARGNEDCGYLNNDQVADLQCSNIMPFFCYTAIGKQQIIRVKVRSNQYPENDPAVKAAFLEPFKQKLKDHWMAENITVKWRKQQDGVVFHLRQKQNNSTKN